MAKISTYATVSPPAGGDMLIGTDVSNSDATKNFTVESLGSYIKSSFSTETKTITLSRAELLALNTTPIELVAAPGANKLTFITKVFWYYKFGVQAYDTSAVPTMAVVVGGGGQELSSVNGTGFLNQASDRWATGGASNFASVASAILNLPIELVCTQPITDPTGTATGTMTLTVQYTTIEIS